jgi:immune inhibitor A
MYTPIRKTTKFGRSLLTVLLLSIVIVLNVSAVPPHPSLLEARAAAKAAGKILPDLPKTSELHARGIDTPEDAFGLQAYAKSRPSGSLALGPFRVLAVLVDFSDHVSQVSGTFYDTLVFGAGSNSVRDYFDEISYAQIDLVTVNLPSTLGWKRAPQTYAYYVNNQYGYGLYPQNSQRLVENLVDAVDAQVDFSNYDNNGDGYVDVMIVIHSGTGAEVSRNAADIWSHKWEITPKMTADGVYVKSYTVQPEFWAAPGDMTIGVYCHELLHGFGLPDLYDIDSSPEFVSNGIGRWGVMSAGIWNGNMGSSPAHPCAWSRIQIGITSPVNIAANVNDQAIPSVNGGGSIFRLWTSGAASTQYFLVENRQQTGYDSYIPGSGLLIWHIDDAKVDNRQEWYPTIDGAHHYLVALEQADGLFELEHANDQGDAADPWPGSLNRTSFNGLSSPTSDAYLTGGTFVAVTDISASGPTMTADLAVGIAASVDDNELPLPGDFRLSQNYPNPFNPNTNIQYEMCAPGQVTLEVYDLLGRHVRTLFKGQADVGVSTITWDATEDNGQNVASGVYFYRLVTAASEQTRKMILLK